MALSRDAYNLGTDPHPPKQAIVAMDLLVVIPPLATTSEKPLVYLMAYLFVGSVQYVSTW